MNQIALISKEVPRNYFCSFKIGDFNPLKNIIVQYFILAQSFSICLKNFKL